MALPHPKPLHPVFFPLRNRPTQPSPNLPLPRNPSLPHLKHESFSRLQASAKDESLSTLITELEKHGDHIEQAAEDDFLPRNSQPEHALSERWREIHGLGDWAGLLDPMDPLLRSEVIRYGELAQACYDAFDYDPFSRYCGSCKYNHRHFFTRLGMPDAGYDITRYIYATSSFKIPNFFASSRGSRTWSERANWIGFVAVSSDEGSAQLGRRDIVVAWRGTVTRLEWIADLMDFLRPVAAVGISCRDQGVKVDHMIFILNFFYGLGTLKLFDGNGKK